jgi:membrane protease YdiL (CAAX protease family)
VIVALLVAGVLAWVLAWGLVASGRLSVWTSVVPVAGIAGVAALATGRLALWPRASAPAAAAAGLGSGVALYLATVGFVLVVRRWPAFDRHVAEIYDQRRGLSLALALLLASGVSAPGEELFWRGLLQWRLGGAMGWAAAAAVAWGAYVVANAAGASLPILAGAAVGGAAWGALALWTHGVGAGLLSHVVWTFLMLALPPGGAGTFAPRGDTDRRVPRAAGGDAGRGRRGTGTARTRTARTARTAAGG